MFEVYALGAGLSVFGRRDTTFLDLAAQAAESATAEGGPVEAIVLGAMSPEEYVHEGNIASQVAERLGLFGVPATRIETASSSGAAAFHLAVQLVAGGNYRRVLAIAVEKMSHVPTSQSTRIMAGVLTPTERQLGLTMPGMAALVTSAYQRQHGVPASRMEKALAAVAIKNHANGALNPYAHLRHPLTEAVYLNSKVIASPLRLFDCAPISDGAAAVVVGRDVGNVRVAGIGQGGDHLSLCRRMSLGHFPASQRAAARAYAMAGLGPDAVTFAEIHDAFTSFELISAEDVGFLPFGGAVNAVLAGELCAGGRKPINASGGLKSRGHPVGASGLAQIVEMVWQMNEVVSRERRVRSPEVGLALSIGGPASNNFVTILKRERIGRFAATLSEHLATSWRAEYPIHDKRPAPPIKGVGRIIASTDIHMPIQGFPVPTRVAIVECAKGGARFLARATGVPLLPGHAVRFALVRAHYRLARIKRLRRVRITARQIMRRVRTLGHKRRAATPV